jgi:predicted SnoaL-like aldol condensation-catalyzing enzyme
VLPIAIALALATGIVLAETRLVVVTPTIPAADSPQENANVTAAARFYAAVNAMLRDGDAAPIDRVVADDFVGHTPAPDFSQNHDGLVATLRSVHAVAPSAHLTVLDAMAQDDRVVVRVRLDAPDGASFLGLPVPLDQLWGVVDILRIRSGQIVESWSDRATSALLAPLLSVSIPIAPPLRKVVELERWVFAAGAELAGQRDSGPLLLVVESGELAIALESGSPATVVHPQGPGTDRPPSTRSIGPGQGLTLADGDALTLPQRSRYAITTPAGATTLVLSLDALSTGRGAASADVDSTPPPKQSARVSGVTHSVLAGGMALDVPDRAVVVRIGRASLPPPTMLPSHSAGVAEFVAVETGALATSVAGGTAWITSAASAGVSTVSSATLTAGSGASIPAGASVSYQSAPADAVATFLLVRLDSEPIPSSASPVVPR